MQDTRHVSLPFINTGPRTDSAGRGNSKLLSRSRPVFEDHLNYLYLSVLCLVTATANWVVQYRVRVAATNHSALS